MKKLSFILLFLISTSSVFSQDSLKKNQTLDYNSRLYFQWPLKEMEYKYGAIFYKKQSVRMPILIEVVDKEPDVLKKAKLQEELNNAFRRTKTSSGSAIAGGTLLLVSSFVALDALVGNYGYQHYVGQMAVSGTIFIGGITGFVIAGQQSKKKKRSLKKMVELWQE